MEKHIIEVFRNGELWCAVFGRDSRQGSFGSGRTMSEALWRLALDIEATERGYVAAERAALGARGTRVTEEIAGEA